MLDTSFSDLPPIPREIQTRDQQKVDTSGDKWSMRVSIWGGGNRVINWQRTKGDHHRHILSKRAWHLTALYIVHRLQRQQTSTVAGNFTSLLHFERWLATQVERGILQFSDESFHWSNITEAIITEYVYDCDKIGAKGKHFKVVQSLYRWGVEQGYQDFDPATLEMLRSISVRTQVSGHIVRSWNPEKGPLSSDEKWLLKQALRQELGQRTDRILIRILLELGVRPQAMLLLRNQDLKRYEMEGGIRYELAITTIKRRTQGRETKGYPISAELGQLLEQQQRDQPDELLLHWLPKAYPEAGIRKALRRFVKKANLVSPRTGKLLNLHPYRLRYTLATYLFEMGAPITAIAAALNHKGTRKAWIYVKTTAAISDSLAKAVDPVLEPLVHRFLGQAIIEALPSNCQNLILNTVPHLQHLQGQTGVVGICKHEHPEECRRAQPLACYLCPSFAALRDGPHQDLLQAIELFVEQGKGKIDASILIQHNDVQIAIQQLLQWAQKQTSTDIQDTEVVGGKSLAGAIDGSYKQLSLMLDNVSLAASEQDGVRERKVSAGA